MLLYDLPCSPSTPSSWVRSWLTTRSVTPVLSWPLLGARESNSSKNRMHGLAACALEQAEERKLFHLHECLLVELTITINIWCYSLKLTTIKVCWSHNTEWQSVNVHQPLEDITDSLLTSSDVLTQKFRSLERGKYPVSLKIQLLWLRKTVLFSFFTVGARAQPTLMLMKFIPLSFATALASRVFPVPGAPNSNIPERWRIGRLENRMGYCNTPKIHSQLLRFISVDVCKKGPYIHCDFM